MGPNHLKIMKSETQLFIYAVTVRHKYHNMLHVVASSIEECIEKVNNGLNSDRHPFYIREIKFIGPVMMWGNGIEQNF